MKTKRLLLPLAVLAAGVVIALLLIRLRPEVERREAPVQPPLVRTVTAEPADHRLDVESQGTAAPRTESTLVAQIAGRIVDVAPSFADGGFFRRGDVLVEIDPRDYRLALEEARAAVAQAETGLALAEAEAELAREEWRELGRGREPTALAAREPQLAEARAAVQAARAAVERAELQLSRTRVEAPYDGRVRTRQVGVGQYVGPGTPLAAVFATDYAEVRLPVPQAELGFLGIDLGAPGDGDGGSGGGGDEAGPAVALSGSIGGDPHTWRGRIVRTAGSIDPRTRMLDLFARVDDPFRRRRGRGADEGDGAAPPLPMGLFLEAEIAGRVAPGVFVLPRAALRDGDRVLVVDADDRLRFRDVTVLRTEGERAVISEGLAAGDRVTVSPLATVTDGMKVRTVDDGAEPASRTDPAPAAELEDPT